MCWQRGWWNKVFSDREDNINNKPCVIATSKQSTYILVSNFINSSENRPALLVSKAKLAVNTVAADVKVSKLCQSKRVIPSCCYRCYHFATEIFDQCWSTNIRCCFKSKLSMRSKTKHEYFAFGCKDHRMVATSCYTFDNWSLLKVEIKLKVFVLLLLSIARNNNLLWCCTICKYSLSKFSITTTTKSIKIIIRC